jgi:hypothetical protein
MPTNKYGYSSGQVTGIRGKEYSPSQTAVSFLAIFGAVLAAAWGMSYLPKVKA